MKPAYLVSTNPRYQPWLCLLLRRALAHPVHPVPSLTLCICAHWDMRGNLGWSVADSYLLMPRLEEEFHAR